MFCLKTCGFRQNFCFCQQVLYCTLSDQKLVHAAGVPVFPEHGVPQVVEALDDNAVLFGGEVEFEFSSFHAIASLVPLLYLGQWPYASVSFPL